MTMKKILMAAVAVSAISAGAANAATISAAPTISGIPLVAADPLASTPVAGKAYAIADTAILTSGGSPTVNGVSTSHTISGGLVSGNFAPNAAGTTYSFTYALTGTANPVFSVPVTSFTLDGAGPGAAAVTGPPAVAAIPACVPTGLNIVSGGAVGTSSVTGVFTVPTSCSSSVSANIAPNGVTLSAPFKISALGTAFGTLSYKMVASDSAYDGAGVTQPLVVTATPYSVKVTADEVATSMALVNSTPANGVYTSLLSGTVSNVVYDNVLGTVTAGNLAPSSTTTTGTVYADLKGTALPAISATTAVNAVSGNFAVIKPSDGATMTLATATASVATGTIASPGGSKTISVSVSGSNTTSVGAPTSYTATVTPSLASNTLVTTPSAVTAAPLQSIGIEGTSFLVPWVGGSQSNPTTTIRIANSSAEAGAVTLSLIAPTYANGVTPGAVLCTSSTNNALAKIPANGELLIDGPVLSACFGAFKRADVLVTIQAPKTYLSAKARNVNAVTNVVTEVSLGGLSVTGVSY